MPGITEQDVASLAFWMGSHRPTQSERPSSPVRSNLMDIEECAQYIGRTVRAVYNLVHKQQIPHVRIGRKLQFDHEKIDRWMERHSRRGALVS